MARYWPFYCRLRIKREGVEMKLYFAMIFGVLSLTGSLNAQDQGVEGPITLEEIRRRNVVGELGITLGTSTEIEAEVVSGRTLQVKGNGNRYLLKVTHVAGKKMRKSPLMTFSVMGFEAINLASQPSDLYELKHGTKVDSLNAKQIEELEKGYVGKKVRLAVYESGTFEGVPKGLPEDLPVWAGVSFQFSTSLIVLKKFGADLPSSKPAR